MQSLSLDLLLDSTGDMALKRRARRIIEGLNIKKGDKILEIGCGDGYYLHLISTLYKNVEIVGFDIDKDALTSAKINLKGKKVKLIYGDILKGLPFKDDSFDKVIMSEVAEHLKDDKKGFLEAKRVLKKKGIISITVPCADYPLFWDPVNKVREYLFGTHFKEGFWAGLWNKHIRLYKVDGLKRRLSSLGFKTSEVVALTYFCLPFNHFLVNLTARAIHSGKMDPNLKSSLNKYEITPKRSAILNVAFKTVNIIDKLNDLIPIKKSGVCVFVLSTK